MGWIHPRNEDGGVDQYHGRVLRSNSSPEQYPSHRPAWATICSCSGLIAVVCFLERTYSVAMRRRTALGVVLHERALAFNSRARWRGRRIVSVSVIHLRVTQ